MLIARRILYIALAIFIPLGILVGTYIAYVSAGVSAGVAHVDGTVRGLAIGAPARIIRDDRGVPHVRAASVRDAFFAQGYATASDRLFQMDVTRRLALGRLTEMFGAATLKSDEEARVVDVRSLAADAFARLTPQDQGIFTAYADGVNAAATHEPLPPEFKALGVPFKPWLPQDSIAVGYSLVLDLSDSWYSVTTRDAVRRAVGKIADDAFFSLTDPAWETPTTGGTHAVVAPLPALPPAATLGSVRNPAPEGDDRRDGLGSNEYVAGAARSRTHRALLANDPHLARTMPGIWHLVDIEAPGFHVAGAALAGVPGVVLGHNDDVAWAATNGDVASPRVYREQFLTADGTTYRAGAATLEADARRETFGDRLGNPHHRTYLRTRHGFVVENEGLVRYAVQWDPDVDRHSPAGAFLALDRATSIDAALRALAQYPGPTENFALAGADGRAAYTLAGHVPLDAGWGLRVFDGSTTLPSPLTFVPFAELPHIAPARDAFAINSNNQPYGAGYRYRLSPAFTAPYRAAEIARRLRGMPAYDVASFHAVQSDTMSLAEHELAQTIVGALRRTGADRDTELATIERDLATFDGSFDAPSVGATIVQRIRAIATRDLIDAHLSGDVATSYLAEGPAFVTLMRALRERPRGWFPGNDRDAFVVREVRQSIELWGGLDAIAQPYGTAYPVTARHVLASLGFHGWDGPAVAGSGGSYAPAVQGIVVGQSFRAVWEAGAWEAGGIDLPIGESGEPGSPHYRDLAGRYARHALTPLPYGDAAVARAAHGTLTLAP